MVKLAALLVLAGCNLYFPDPPSHQHGLVDPDAAASPLPPDASSLNDPACWQLTCQPTAHTEVQCEPPGTGGCIHDCHCACVPNEACATIDCGTTATCVQTCSRECQGMPEICDQACVATTSAPACETAATEAACLALAPSCVPVYRGVGCTCVELACDCQSDHGAYARCEAAAPP